MSDWLSVVLGAPCFVITALVFALQPKHSWTEATGEPEAYDIEPEVELVRDTTSR